VVELKLTIDLAAGAEQADNFVGADASAGRDAIPSGILPRSIAGSSSVAAHS
jgi:hypothetical protein